MDDTGANVRILVVEDDEGVMKTHKTVFAKIAPKNWEVIFHTITGQAVNEILFAERAFDVVFTDYENFSSAGGQPIREDPVELLYEARLSNPDCLLIITSGEHSNAEKLAQLPHAVAELIKGYVWKDKPFSAFAAIEEIKRLLGERTK